MLPDEGTIICKQGKDPNKIIVEYSDCYGSHREYEHLSEQRVDGWPCF